MIYTFKQSKHILLLLIKKNQNRPLYFIIKTESTFKIAFVDRSFILIAYFQHCGTKL